MTVFRFDQTTFGPVTTAGGWFIHPTPPCDVMAELTTAADWMAGSGLAPQEALDVMFSAFQALSAHPWYDGEPRGGRFAPRVVIEHRHAGPVFIWKVDNNGTTFLVASHYLPDAERLVEQLNESLWRDELPSDAGGPEGLAPALAREGTDYGF